MKKFIYFAVLSAAMLLCFSVPCLAAQTAAEKRFENSGLMVLVNQSHSLPKDYAPEKLQNIAKVVRSSKSEMLLRPEAAQAYIELYNAMVADGVPAPIAISGYRTYDYQAGLFNNKVNSYKSQGYSNGEAAKKAATSVAAPGTSEHQTGLAIDISVDGSLSSSFEETAAGKWLIENSWRFGFILRYKGEKSDITGIINEPWHYRYVGAPHAQIMYENNWCLEEYTEYVSENAPVFTEASDGTKYAVYHISETAVPAVDTNEELLDFSFNNDGNYVLTVIKLYEKPEKEYTAIIIPMD